ncbi:hypothetical protein AVEN_215546-1 [Araneus ventricosus]|uniref:Uncharacterized protein n=1 Tax=Araneus ventricosus TaxID=182803 RepID=A0A4Y2BGX2_ARAVE|nr:hypothetical protein AVEN_215546-1 [Araneus ventricosus]
MPIPRGCLPKSELIRDFQSELITQLSSVLRSLKTSSRLLIQFLPPFLPRTSRFIHPFKEWSSAYLSLDWIMVLLVDQQITFFVPSGQPLLWEGTWVSPPPGYSGVTPKGTANALYDSY